MSIPDLSETLPINSIYCIEANLFCFIIVVFGLFVYRGNPYLFTVDFFFEMISGFH